MHGRTFCSLPLSLPGQASRGSGASRGASARQAKAGEASRAAPEGFVDAGFVFLGEEDRNG